MSIFRFKKFEVRNEKSAMKVNTDGVLLGAACPVRPDMKNVLDIGTGTGTIALMLAQRISALTQTTDSSIDLNIIGIDIDEDAAAEAGANFAASAWAGSLEARRQALAELSDDRAFDLIVSNSPYYDSSLTNPDAKKTAARHTDETGLSFREVLEFAGKHLAQEGIVHGITGRSRSLGPETRTNERAEISGNITHPDRGAKAEFQNYHYLYP